MGRETGASSPQAPGPSGADPGPFRAQKVRQVLRETQVTRAVAKLKQITQANEKGEEKNDRVTARLLSGRGSSESGLQRYEEQLRGWRVSHSPALPSREGEGQQHSRVTPTVHYEMMKDESPGSALQQNLHFPSRDSTQGKHRVRREVSGWRWG